MGISPGRSSPGNKTGPLLVLIMISDWDVGAPKMWKYVAIDDTSMAETIKKGDVITFQDSVDELAEQALANKFQLNQGKCKNCGLGLLNLLHILTQLKLTIAPWRWYSVLRFLV